MADPRYVSLTAPAGGYESQLANIVRRQKLAELLAQQGGEDIKVESVNGIPTPISPFQGLAKVLQSGVGAYLGGKADEDLATAKAKEAKDVSDIFAGLADRPDVKTEGYYLPTEQPSKTMPIGMPRGASSFMPEGEATNMGTYVPGTVTPGQHLSRSEKTNRIMAAMAAHPSMAALAPMYVQNMQSEVEDTRYQAGLDRAEAARVLEATRYAEEQKQKAADDAESLRRYEKTLAATNAGRSPGTPQSYIIDGKQVFTTPQDALSRAQGGSAVTTAAEGKPKTQVAKTVDQLKNEQLYDVVTPELQTLTKNWGELGKRQNQIFAAVGETKIPFTNIGIPKGSVTGTEYQLAETSLSVIAASYIYSVSGATASPDEVKKTVSALMPAFGEGEEQKKAKLDRIKTMVQAIGARAKGGFNEAAPLDADEQEYMRLKAIEKANG